MNQRFDNPTTGLQTLASSPKIGEAAKPERNRKNPRAQPDPADAGQPKTPPNNADAKKLQAPSGQNNGHKTTGRHA